MNDVEQVWGVFDFAGGIVVHATAGFGALASLFVVGPRVPGPGETKDDLDTPHSIPLVALGTSLLWFGWSVLLLATHHRDAPPPLLLSL